ncbi:MAG: aromatic ring-hydroxylating dioxygenase subunit alpha [Actinobacteria bacterium]|nr:aromatic ring-hydroxylating dioxygenase subunit alpha [Actinomycetota bacterium]
MGGAHSRSNGVPAEWLVGADGFVPKERYTHPRFLELEEDHLFGRVWQIACRVEEVEHPGDVVEYGIGDQSVLVTRAEDGALHAFHNVCLHRGARLVDGCTSAPDGGLRCPFHGWRYALDGTCIEVVDADDFTALPRPLRIPPVRVESWGGFVFVNLDPDAEPLLEFLDPLPAVLAPFHLEQMRLRSVLTTVLPTNWKAAVDAFNEAYHVQSGHRQTLPFVDDVSIVYELLGKHAHYGRLPGARRVLRPSPRLGIPDAEVDEATILRALVSGLGGAFLGEERDLVDDLIATGPPPGQTLLGAYQERRMTLLARRGLDVSGLGPDQMTSVEDLYLFPNVVGPVYPGSAILFRARPVPGDPDHTYHDTFVLQWPDPDVPPAPPKRRDFPRWRERDWGTLTMQDYENVERVQRGMKSAAFRGLRLNPRQEINLLHMHRTIDEYLTRATVVV